MNCQDFHDRLLDLVSGHLDRSTVRVMLEHGTTCKECEVILALEEALQVERDEGTLEEVPTAWVRSMWPKVEGRISSSGRNRPRAGRIPGRRAVAAAAAVALLSVAFVLGRHTAVLERSPSPRPGPMVESPAARGNDSTREDLLRALDRLPAGLTLLSAAETSALVERSVPLRRWIRESPLAIDIADGVQAAELRDVLMARPEENGILLPASLRPRELRRWLERRV